MISDHLSLSGGNEDNRTSIGGVAMQDVESGESAPRRFPTTHWSRIAEAQDLAAPGARDALTSLCQSYWYPLYLFIRRRGHPADDARDLVQEYFVRLLTGPVLEAADRSKGRFRTFLIADCTRFLSHQRARARAQKRGGDRQIFSIDAGEADSRYQHEPGHDLTAEHVYRRAWALTLLDTVLARLRAEYERAGRGEVFHRLKEVLTVGPDSVPYATIAAELATTEGAVQVAVHRLRRRYGALLREEIGCTVTQPSDVEDEIRELFAALGP
jgi:RNA polymerase sigma factor (sigma-70 family)